MARVKIDISGDALAVIKVPIRISDINYGNHLGNDALVSILHEARVQWLNKLQYSELDIGGAGLIMSDLAVEYKHESFYGDELAVSIFTGEVSAAGFEILYAVSNHLNVLIAKAKTGMVCYDYEKKKVTAIPEKFRELIARQQQH